MISNMFSFASVVEISSSFTISIGGDILQSCSSSRVNVGATNNFYVNSRAGSKSAITDL